MPEDPRDIDEEWNQLAEDFEDELEVEFLDEDDLVEFVHDTEF
jgi:hypothetical protein